MLITTMALNLTNFLIKGPIKDPLSVPVALISPYFLVLMASRASFYSNLLLFVCLRSCFLLFFLLILDFFGCFFSIGLSVRCFCWMFVLVRLIFLSFRLRFVLFGCLFLRSRLRLFFVWWLIIIHVREGPLRPRGLKPLRGLCPRLVLTLLPLLTY